MRLIRTACSLIVFLAAALGGCSRKPAAAPQYTPNPAPLPADFAQAFDAYQPEGTRGWTFTQETSSGEERIRERHDASLPEFKRWTLLEKNGHVPSDEETKKYNEMMARHPRSEGAPNVRNQVLRDSWTELAKAEDGLRRFQFRLKPGAEDDYSAAHMAVTFCFDPVSASILRVELTSLESFSPTFGVRIQSANTTVRYSPPSASEPWLIREIRVEVRGRAFGFKKLDQEMKVVYSGYEKPAAAKP